MSFLDRFRRPRTAAVAPIGPQDRRAWHRQRQPWQERADYFSTHLGVVRFASGIGSDACSRCDLRVEKLVDPGSDTWEPTGKGLHAAVLRQYRGKRTTQRELIRQHAWHEDTIGEALILLEQDNRGRPAYSVRSPLAAEPQGEGLLIRDVPGGTLRDNTARWLPDERIFRAWIPNERWPGWAESPLHGVMEDCERYWTLGRRMKRTYESALTGNGMVFIPSEAQPRLPRGQTEPGAPGQPRTDMERDYYEAAHKAFSDDDSIEAVTALMISYSGDLAKPEHIDLMSKLDEHAIEHRTEALEAIARGLNYPQRVLLDGGAGMNHWGAFLLQDSFVREAVNPKMERICWGDLSDVFLRPAFRALGAEGLFDDDPDLYRVGFDPTPVIVHPDQTTVAIDLYKLGVVSDLDLLEITGFDLTALPNEEELKRWIARTQIMRETIRPQLTTAMPPDVQEVVNTTPTGGGGGLPATAPPGVTAAIDVDSAVRVPVGPMPGEESSWLS